ncbi:hypothetical protein HDA35_005833 [Micromonospora purpureochromogenes]|uniref:Uncharacterized protein n=1 Tax=Micromonospora purpureochromogenes TaxID=47872 RepID=A0ABX2RTY1_9ACTN|nr:hypothetical protein [Micromonospora purpureochromogenes]NYF60002.1 hypothetical protein [Micromonospora purpureochromogenes]
MIQRLGIGHRGDRLFDAVGGEGGGQPGIEWVGERVLRQVYVAGMCDLVGEGVLLWKAAAVVGVAVVVLALHASIVAGVPAHDPGMAHRHVVDVEQHLVGALLVPYLPAGVAGVGEDDADGALGPGDAAAVPIAGPVVC